MEEFKTKYKTKVGMTPCHSESKDDQSEFKTKYKASVNKTTCYSESKKEIIKTMEEKSKPKSVNVDNDKIKNHYEIKCGGKEDLLKVREMIHNSLVGNPDYIDNKIILTDSVAYPDQYPENPGEYIIELFVFADSTTDITDTMAIINLVT